MAYIKRDIEEKILSLSKEYSCILITGPRQVGKTTVLRQLMELAQESLAGRVAILHMSSLSQHEVYESGNCTPFTLELGALKEREKTNAPADIAEIYDRIWKGSMPGLASSKFSDRDVFYSSYLQTYIDQCLQSAG